MRLFHHLSKRQIEALPKEERVAYLRLRAEAEIREMANVPGLSADLLARVAPRRVAPFIRQEFDRVWREIADERVALRIPAGVTCRPMRCSVARFKDEWAWCAEVYLANSPDWPPGPHGFCGDAEEAWRECETKALEYIHSLAGVIQKGFLPADNLSYAEAIHGLIVGDERHALEVATRHRPEGWIRDGVHVPRPAGKPAISDDLMLRALRIRVASLHPDMPDGDAEKFRLAWSAFRLLRDRIRGKAR
jgi:hypothetical protein